MSGGGPVSLTFAAWCENVAGAEWACMVDETAPAVGHVTVVGGPHDGRCLAVVCGHHASEDGYAEFKERLVDWMMAGLLSTELGRGAHGAPEVLHREPGHWHRDPMPEHRHETEDTAT
jgi:hypothetical protein